MTALIDELKSLYQQLNADNLSRLDALYADDIEFVDPFHNLHGLAALKNYFSRLYEDVDHIAFEFGHCMIEQDKALLTWTMSLSHPRLNKGKTVLVSGASELAFDTKIFYHRDYFDAGAMIYEHIPLLRSFIAAIKRRMA